MAGKQIKKPIDIPRPGKKGQKGQRQGEDAKGRPMMNTPPAPPSQQRQQQQGRTPAASRDAAFKQGIDVLRKSAKPRG